MTYQIKRNKKAFFTQETTAFTKENPAGANAVNVKYDSIVLDPTKETIENMLISNGLHDGKTTDGLRGAAGSISTYLKAMGTEGEKPEYWPLLEATLGATPDVATTKNIDNTSATSTTTTIEFDDTHTFKVGQHVIVKIPGAFECIPVESIGVNNIVLAYALQTTPADGTTISAVTTWNTKSEPTPFSVDIDIEKGEGTEQASGCVVTGCSGSGITVGQQSFLDFSYEGLTYTRNLNDVGVTPVYDTAQSPVITNACLVNTETGDRYDFSEFSWNIENTWQIITDACAETGKVGYKLVGRKASGSFNPNKIADLQHYTNFDTNATYGLSISFKVPTVAGEFKDVMGLYFPKVQTSNLTEGEDGVMKESVEWNAFVEGDTDTDKGLVYISSI